MVLVLVFRLGLASVFGDRSIFQDRRETKTKAKTKTKSEQLSRPAHSGYLTFRAYCSTSEECPQALTFFHDFFTTPLRSMKKV